MPARPIETFQSEGWYRPSGARSEHYFRPSDRMSARLGTPSLEAICAPKNGLGYGSSEGIRPWLESTARGRVCKQCAQIQEAALFAEGDWFGSGDPSPSGPASQLERGIDAPTQDHDEQEQR